MGIQIICALDTVVCVYSNAGQPLFCTHALCRHTCTQVSTTMAHSGPHDPVLPPLLPLSTQLSERSPPLCLLNFNGGEVQLAAHLTREASSQSKLYQPSSRPDWSRLLNPSKRQLHRTAEPQKQGPQNQQDDFTGLQTAHQPFSLFMDV